MLRADSICDFAISLHWSFRFLAQAHFSQHPARLAIRRKEGNKHMN
jgi:hypothetical protein